jgi:hypothetical protein
MLNMFSGSFLGVRIVESPLMVDTVEDWSGCRSIPRAKRRHARGIKTAMRLISVPKKNAYAMDNGRTLVMHPEMARQMRAEAAKDAEQLASERFLRKVKPQPNANSPWRPNINSES